MVKVAADVFGGWRSVNVKLAAAPSASFTRTASHAVKVNLGSVDESRITLTDLCGAADQLGTGATACSTAQSSA